MYKLDKGTQNGATLIIRREFAKQGSLMPAHQAIEELNKFGIKITQMGPNKKSLQSSMSVNQKQFQGVLTERGAITTLNNSSTANRKRPVRGHSAVARSDVFQGQLKEHLAAQKFLDT